MDARDLAWLDDCMRNRIEGWSAGYAEGWADALADDARRRDHEQHMDRVLEVTKMAPRDPEADRAAASRRDGRWSR